MLSISKRRVSAAGCKCSRQLLQELQMRANRIVMQQDASRLFVAGQAALAYAGPTAISDRPEELQCYMLDHADNVTPVTLLWQSQTTSRCMVHKHGKPPHDDRICSVPLAPDMPVCRYCLPHCTHLATASSSSRLSMARACATHHRLLSGQQTNIAIGRCCFKQ
jgi:hypothetical protein